MAEHPRYLSPDFVIVNQDSGKEVVVVEVKSSIDAESGLEQLRHYLMNFYSDVGLLVTPERTYVVKEDYYGDIVEANSIPTEVIFGRATGFEDSNFKDFIHIRLIDIIASINNDLTVDSLKLLSWELKHLLKNTNVIRRRGR